jgi:hypothetical protein
MTDSAPVPPQPAPPPASQPAPAPGRWGPVGKVRNPWFVAFISIITLGIYWLYWNYQVFREMKEHSGEGVGPVVGLILAIFVSVVNAFLIPHEVGNIYTKAGQERPVSWATAFWNLIPLVGWFIWVFKVQGALNRRWESAVG